MATFIDSTYFASTNAGTRGYTSPEMNDGKKYSFNTDVWSAGCVLFELITLKKYNHFKQNPSEHYLFRAFKVPGKLIYLLKM